MIKPGETAERHLRQVQSVKKAEAEINMHFAALFTGPLGEKVLKILRKQTIEAVCGPFVTNDQLRHLEGQRFLVGQIEQRVRAGHKAKEKQL